LFNLAYLFCPSYLRANCHRTDLFCISTPCANYLCTSLLYTSYFREAVYNQLTIQFALDYTERNRDKLSNFKSVEQFANYLEKQNIVEQFANYAQEHGLKRRNLMIQRSFPLINKNLIANIIYNVEEQSARLQYLAADDKAIKQALDIFKQNKAFPTANDKK
jgi:carboxyl-terminal processing protease